MLVVDLAKNYSFKEQNEIQSMHWYSSHVTIFVHITYFQIAGSKITLDQYYFFVLRIQLLMIFVLCRWHPQDTSLLHFRWQAPWRSICSMLFFETCKMASTNWSKHKAPFGMVWWSSFSIQSKNTILFPCKVFQVLINIISRGSSYRGVECKNQ